MNIEEITELHQQAHAAHQKASELDKALQLAVRDYLRLRGSTSELARRMKFGRSYLNDMRQGRRKVSDTFLARLREAEGQGNGEGQT